MMENIYKIKIRSNLDPRNVYPSERRYSSSIVLGFSVMFLALAVTSSLMGTLIVKRITTNTTITNESEVSNENSTILNSTTNRLLNKIEKDLFLASEPHFINTPALVSAGVFVMSIGHILGGITGILAWKQWYIDHNITWFFLASCFSAVTSSISLLLISLTLTDMCTGSGTTPEISLGLSANIIITSLLGIIWSVVASRVSFRGMKSNYPDDIILAKMRGRVEVSTIKQGNKIAKVIPPDILNHFPTTGKLAKYLPKKNDRNLPKEESNKEYEDRVNRFLSGGQENRCEENK